MVLLVLVEDICCQYACLIRSVALLDLRHIGAVQLGQPNAERQRIF